MGLEKLTIKVEDVTKSKADQLVFGDYFMALFNPDKLVFSKSANWAQQDPKESNSPGLHFTNANPRTLKLDLIFDTFDPDPENAKNKDHDVREVYTDNILNLITVKKDEPRPPVCRLIWGSAGYFFQGVLQQLEQTFTLFTENGTPVRAKLSCSFMEWWVDYEKLNKQVAIFSKTYVVKSGDTLSSIAAQTCNNPKEWRSIAVKNGIDNPRVLKPGTPLLLPTPSGRSR